MVELATTRFSHSSAAHFRLMLPCLFVAVVSGVSAAPPDAANRTVQVVDKDFGPVARGFDSA